MSKTVLIATDKPFAPVAVQGIREVVEKAGYKLKLLEKYTEPEQFHAAVGDVDAVIIRSDLVTKEVIEAGKQLKIVVRAGAGYDNVDLEAATAKKVCVMNTPGQNSNAVAELAFGMMITMARANYQGKSGFELRGKTIGIHAYGAVGRCVARIAKGFEMTVVAFDPFVAKDAIQQDGVEPVGTVEDLYKRANYLSLHIPANDKTKKSINSDLLGLLPKGATLVNTARKEVIDEPSLIKFMSERTDFRYVSDVAPDCQADLKAQFADRVLFTAKKMGAQTEEANINAGIAAARQIVDFLEKGDRTFQVNK